MFLAKSVGPWKQSEKVLSSRNIYYKNVLRLQSQQKYMEVYVFILLGYLMQVSILFKCLNSDHLEEEKYIIKVYNKTNRQNIDIRKKIKIAWYKCSEKYMYIYISAITIYVY